MWCEDSLHKGSYKNILDKPKLCLVTLGFNVLGEGVEGNHMGLGSTKLRGRNKPVIQFPSKMKKYLETRFAKLQAKAEGLKYTSRLKIMVPMWTEFFSNLLAVKFIWSVFCC